MPLTRKEADRLVRGYGAACIGVGGYNRTPAYYSACRERDRLCPELLTALCASPNAALLEACQRLYDICYFLTVRQAVHLGDDAITALGLNPYCINEGLADGTERINLEWAKEAIAEAEEG